MNALTSSSTAKKSGFLGLFGGGNGENGLLKSAGGLLSCLDSVQANVLVADKEFNLIYANPCAVKTLEGIKEQIYTAFGVSINDLVGGSIHRFHKDPQKIEKILRNPSALLHTAEFSFGDVTLTATINAISGSDGVVSGYVVNWEDVTKINRTKRAMARINSMMENAPVNVIFADIDTFEITYVNPASIKTLKTIEQHLPISVDKIMGVCIDVFHKNPAHQRKLLSDPNNLPHRANIMVGPETLDLLVSAIYDKDKNYLGPMVTWEVITEKLAAEKREKEMSASIKEIAHNAHQGTKITNDAVQLADSTNKTVTKLGESSAETGQVIKVITSIAEQTNLLALNATIEVARAGEAGKGFALVANEVKELANQTAKAIEEISSNISAIQGDTQSAVTAIGEISNVIGQISDISNTIASAVEEQSTTTNEITRNVSEASRGSQEIAQNISGVAKAANSTTEGATDTEKAAGELSKLAADLQDIVSQFNG